MKDLEELSPDRFDRRERVALQWVKTYLLYEGMIPDPALVAEFESLYPSSERVDIFAVFKLMLFFNMLANTVRK
ncbi:MAG: hypothetical protein SWC96_00185 [Thermodesulfobacteriota bacterium]|nr:hypothetical protein [Thermodesulfobacteriota bacterium]